VESLAKLRSKPKKKKQQQKSNQRRNVRTTVETHIRGVTVGGTDQSRGRSCVFSVCSIQRKAKMKKPKE